MKINEILKEFNLRQVQRWAIFSIVIGIVSGFGAILFYLGLRTVSYYVLGGIGGYYPPSPGGELPIFSQPATNVKWLLYLLPAAGGLIAGIMIYTYAPEAEGHGTDAVIDSYNNKRGLIRKRVPLIKAISSIITIGSGGSAGREGPIAQIGAGFGSAFASFLKLSDRDRRIMVICGTAAGIGSIFKAPLGGAIFAIEVLYKSDMETEGLVPAFISSTVAYSIFSSFFGWGHIFTTPGLNFTNPVELVFYGILGILCAITAILFVIIFYGLRDKVFRPLKIKPHFKPAIGGLLVGIVAIIFPQVLGTGYGWTQIAINGDIVKMSIILMMVLVLTKILATSFTISSGGSGGVFAPSLGIGGMVGGAFGQIMALTFPNIIFQPGSYALVGMGALLAGVAKVPIAAIVMVSEMAGNYNLLAPMMVASTISYMLAGKWTIYEKQVENRSSSPAHRREMTVDILESAQVKDAMTTNIVTVSPSLTVQVVLDLIHKYGYTGFPVVDNEKLVGIITFEDAEKVPSDKRETTEAKDAMTKELMVAEPEDSLEDALMELLDKKIGRLPVVKSSDPTKLVGILTKLDIIRTHAKLSSSR
ncbi:H(+)/Cl(-) exchange transporter ClcA [Methanosarcinales archaeon]|nr:chloride channel protein [Candidatus Methanoperedens sp.]CAG0958856.1 H(+)/Cl(-) exchange transporter ClcA [Methanosarcinales archaeon]